MFLANCNNRDFLRVLPTVKFALWCECVRTVVRVGAYHSVLVDTLWCVFLHTKKPVPENWLVVSCPYQTVVANGLLHLDAHLSRGVAVGRTVGISNEVASA